MSYKVKNKSGRSACRSEIKSEDRDDEVHKYGNEEDQEQQLAPQLLFDPQEIIGTDHGQRDHQQRKVFSGNSGSQQQRQAGKGKQPEHEHKRFLCFLGTAAYSAEQPAKRQKHDEQAGADHKIKGW